MGKRPPSGITGLAIAGVMAFALQPSYAAATPAVFDGAWNIVLVTEAGACPSGQVGVSIQGGKVTVMGVAFSGGVDSRGRVAVSLQNGMVAGEAIGRLTGDRGRGKWHGTLSQNACTGRWDAERR